MDTRHNDDLVQRVLRLERESRRWRCAAVALGGALGIFVLMGATTAGLVPVAAEIRAKRFVLVDEAGRTRAELRVSEATDEGAWAGLTVYDESGRRIVDAGGGTERGETSSLTLYRPGGSGVRAALVGSPRTARLILMHPRAGEFGGVHLEAHEFGASSMFLSDTKGFAQAGLVVDSKGSPYLRLNAADDQGFLLLGAERTGPLTLRLHDEQGHLRTVLGSTALETAKTGSVEQRPASSLVLFNKDGKVLFKAP